MLLRPGAADIEVVRLGPLSIRAMAQTPGRLHIRVDGRLVQTLDFWDYDPDIGRGDHADPGIARGTKVTVTVEPAGMGGDWLVAVQSLGPPL